MRQDYGINFADIENTDSLLSFAAVSVKKAGV
jgi:hypothetical protein